MNAAIAIAIIVVVAAMTAFGAARVRQNRRRALLASRGVQRTARADALDELHTQAREAADGSGWAPARRWTPSAARTRSADAEREALVPQERWIHVGEVFSPAAPVQRQDLFAGRQQQMEDLINVGFERGQHAAVFGERGVGKTSLATIMTSVFAALENKIVVRVNCDATDTFDSVWRKVIDEIHILAALRTDDRAEHLRSAVEAAENELADVDQMRANDVRKLLRMVSNALDCIVFIDEFERLKDPRSTASFAETIKILSDESVAATIVLVGVGDNLEELLSEHGSIERALAQIHMPRMSREELSDIVEGGLEMLDMKIEHKALATIVDISRGLPHFTHLIAQSSARAAIDAGERAITSDHVSSAIRKLSYRTQETVLNAYSLATTSKRDTIYPQVLLACALAPSDQQGFFSASDVVEPLSEVMARPYPIPSFSRHLHALSETTRGPALQRRGTEHRYRFRFMNPLLQPYVLMKGIAEGSILDSQLERFLSEATGEESG